MNSILKTENLHKEYLLGTGPIEILKGIDIEFNRRELVCIMGPSGSGKSTLLGILGTLDIPTCGQVYLEGQELTNLSEADLSSCRANKIGFVFQSFNLISTMNAMENVMLPLFGLKGVRRGDIRNRAAKLLELVGMGERFKHLPSQLSGGQQQRVALARALVNTPAIVIADEPTGNLDEETGKTIIDLICSLRDDLDMCFIIATHDPSVARRADRVIHLRDGLITNIEMIKG